MHYQCLTIYMLFVRASPFPKAQCVLASMFHTAQWVASPIQETVGLADQKDFIALPWASSGVASYLQVK